MRIAVIAGALAAAIACVAAGSVTLARQSDADTHQPTDVLNYVLGSKHAIGYFVGVNGECRVTLMIAEVVDPDVAMPPSAVRLVLTMRPGQSAGLDSIEGESMVFTCGPGAETIRVTRAPQRPAATAGL